jgi:hypothetical protein
MATGEYKAKFPVYCRFARKDFSHLAESVRDVVMSKKAFGLSRKGPDHLTEELSSVLQADAWFEFKALFELVHASLKSRNLGRGDMEMMRLRAYEKLQTLVRVGVVEKKVKEYRGNKAALEAFREKVAAEHCRQLLRTVKVETGPRAAHIGLLSN